ncbi:MAG: type II toxin-antitoxin system VapC family toxin [Myxococcales bacterium]|nr:type II toxin-antitoxin system VapC family toxin [Myxococcales bacterium]
MILPDVNLLVYAHNADAPAHAASRHWWESLHRDDLRVGMPWAVALGFVRIMTHRAVLARPMLPARALDLVRSWIDRPNVEVLTPGPRHLELLGDLLREAGSAGALTTDAHLAALAIEHQCTLHSNDNDFARFSGLRWENPLAPG